MANGKTIYDRRKTNSQISKIISYLNSNVTPATGAVGTLKESSFNKRTFQKNLQKKKSKSNKYILHSTESSKPYKSRLKHLRVAQKYREMNKKRQELKSKSDTMGNSESSKKKLKDANSKSEQKLDVEKLDSISEVYMKNSNEWNDLGMVEVKLTELQDQLNKTTNDKIRKQINCLISTYEVQLKRLLMQKNQDLQSINNEGNSYMSPINISGSQETASTTDSTKDEDALMSEIATVTDVEEVTCLTQGTTNTSTKDKGEISEKNTTKKKGSPPTQIKRKSTADTSHNIQPAQKKPSYINVLSGVKGNEKSEFRSSNSIQRSEAESNAEAATNEIRIRFQFKGKNDGKVTKLVQLQEVMYSMMHCAKMVDMKCSLLPWKTDDKSKALNGIELKLMSEEVLFKYIDTNKKVTKYIDGKQYYDNGLRLKTELSVKKFVHQWNLWKYDKNDDSPFQDWKAIRPAEMQFSDKMYPVGYFAGSTEKGDYNTLEYEIKKDTGLNIELSYQMINQKGISNQVWQYAREMAERESPNPNSKLHRQTKFSFAPSGLVAYVGSLDEVKHTRRVLTEKYGKLQKQMWPKMPDGSRMRFTPILQTYVKDKKLQDHLYRSLWTQSVSKGGEIYIDLQYNDLYSPKEYLKNNTLEWVIHNALSEKKPGLPLFKHITTKWTRDFDEGQKQLAVSAAMRDEAIEFIKRMDESLVDAFGKEVECHFKSNQIERRTGFTNKDGFVEEIEDYLLNLDVEDQYQNVLIEGMDLLRERNKQQKSTKQKQIKKNTNNDKASEQEMSVIQTMEEISMLTGIENIIPMSEKEKKKASNTLKKYSISNSEIEIWKNKHINGLDELYSKTQKNEYEVVKRIVASILEERKVQAANEQEESSLTKLMSLTEEEELILDEAITNKTIGHTNPRQQNGSEKNEF